MAKAKSGMRPICLCGDFVYHGSLAVAYILTPNGQLTRNPSTGAYTSQYNITDHLGNVRSVVNSSGTVLQSTDYYPFGLAFADANVADNHLGRPFLIFRQIGARGSVIEGAWKPMDVRQQLKSGYGAHRHS